MTPLVIAIILCAVGCVVHFLATRPNGAPTLAELGRSFIWAGAFAITLLLTWKS